MSQSKLLKQKGGEGVNSGQIGPWTSIVSSDDITDQCRAFHFTDSALHQQLTQHDFSTEEERQWRVHNYTSHR